MGSYGLLLIGEYPMSQVLSLERFGYAEMWT